LKYVRSGNQLKDSEHSRSEEKEYAGTKCYIKLSCSTCIFSSDFTGRQWFTVKPPAFAFEDRHFSPRLAVTIPEFLCQDGSELPKGNHRGYLMQ